MEVRCRIRKGLSFVGAVLYFVVGYMFWFAPERVSEDVLFWVAYLLVLRGIQKLVYSCPDNF